jgi:hypothetical protein
MSAHSDMKLEVLLSLEDTTPCLPGCLQNGGGLRFDFLVTEEMILTGTEESSAVYNGNYDRFSTKRKRKKGTDSEGLVSKRECKRRMGRAARENGVDEESAMRALSRK